MSKAFTKDDDDAAFIAPEPALRSASFGWISRIGARLAHDALANHSGDESASLETERLKRLLTNRIAEPSSEDLVALGARVRFVKSGKTKELTLVSPEEVGLVPHGVSIAAPIAVALMGSRVGDECELEESDETLRILAIDYPR